MSLELYEASSHIMQLYELFFLPEEDNIDLNPAPFKIFISKGTRTNRRFSGNKIAALK